MPKVTVIIPVYNTGLWLEECLESVITQTLTDLEIICIDDASTDNSQQILRRYAQRDARIRIITLHQNQGLSYARNIGIDIATGEYLYFLDSDDMITMNAMERLYDISEINHTNITYFDVIRIIPDTLTGGNKYVPVVRSKSVDMTTSGITLIESFLTFDEWHPFVQVQFYSTDFIRRNNLRFYEGIIHEDELFSFQCAIAAERVFHLQELLFYKRSRRNSITHSPQSAKNFAGYFCGAYYTNQLIHMKLITSKTIKAYSERLFFRAIVLFRRHQDEILSEVEKLQDKELLAAYEQFEAIQNACCGYGRLSESIILLLQEYEKIYIYGAGIIAQSVHSYLITKGFIIKGFIVTNMEFNPMILQGCPVQDVSSFVLSEEFKDSFVIIALKNGKDEIKEKLNQLGVRNACYDERIVL